MIFIEPVSKILGMLVIVLLLVLAGVFGRTQTPADVKAFVGATLIDGTGKQAFKDAVVVVRQGRVESVGSAAVMHRPDNAQIIDLAGKFIIPGLISTHVHISNVQGLSPPAYADENTLRQLRVFARYGVTTVWCLGGEREPAFRARGTQNVASLDRSRIYLAGEVIVGKTPQEARQMVAKVATNKPDVIKIRVDDNLGATAKMPPEVYRAVIDEAHRLGHRVAAHIFYLDDAKDLLRAGVDFIAHSVRDREIDEEFISLMKKREIPYCPTLTRELATFVYESTPEFFSDPFFLQEADRNVIAQLLEPERQEAVRKSKSAQSYKAALSIAQRNLKKAGDAGLLIVMGTDAGAFPNRFQGYFEHLEMEMMSESGLTPRQVLRAATGDAARAMKIEDIGNLVKGAWADMVVLDRDPLTDIRNTRSINSIWIAGNRVKKATPPKQE
jgi:imidazolonepropionase-like amidohydrolase